MRRQRDDVREQVDELLAGRKVELVFDPFDLADIQVRYDGHAPPPPHPHRGRRPHHLLLDQHALGVVTGEVGVGKTVAVRAALASLDPTRHHIIYLGNPTIGTMGIHHAIVVALG